jgi:hypothetical protein
LRAHDISSTDEETPEGEGGDEQRVYAAGEPTS